MQHLTFLQKRAAMECSHSSHVLSDLHAFGVIHGTLWLSAHACILICMRMCWTWFHKVSVLFFLIDLYDHLFNFTHPNITHTCILFPNRKHSIASIFMPDQIEFLFAWRYAFAFAFELILSYIELEFHSSVLINCKILIEIANLILD